MTASTSHNSIPFPFQESPFSYGKRLSPSTGKERDVETGYGYFGARYIDHELMTGWLSIDPMADKYPGISPYAYCAWNPVKFVDPDGKEIWKPEITSCGEVSYVAENGDSKLTFQKQYNVSKSATDKIFSESGISNVKQGDRISGEKIASIVTNNTGRKYNDVLKINWNNASKKQIAYHTMFAILCNHIRGGETIDMNQFICGMPSETGDPANLNLRDVDIPLPDGKTMLLQAFNSSFNSKYSKLSPQPLGQFDRADGSSSSNHEYDQPTKLGGSGIQRLLVSFSGKYNDAYTNAYYQ